MSAQIGRFHKTSLAVATAAATIAYAAAAAEPMSEVIVETPKVVHTTDRAGSVGAGIDVASIRYRVSYADLNLATHSGATTLEERINEAAKRACKQLETAAGPAAMPVAGDPPCVKTAADGAMTQAHEAIAAAEKAAKK